MINQNELEIGDLIFYVTPSLDIVEHTSIYLGEKEGIPYVLHATKDSYKAIMVTRLKNTSDADFKYRVVRPKDVSLAIEAIVILLRWVEYQVPYASSAKIHHLMAKAEQLFSFELKSSASQQAEFGKKTYRPNYSQYLTLANALPFVTEENGEVEGFGCAESIVNAFNLALLMKSASFELSNGHTSWFFNGETLDDFISKLHNPLPFDARVSLSAGLYDHCENSPQDWQVMGDLQPQAALIPIDEEAKEIWRTFRDALKKRSSYLMERRRSTSTPSFLQTYTSFHSIASLETVIAHAEGIDNPSLEESEGLRSSSENSSRCRPRARTISSESPLLSFFFTPPGSPEALQQKRLSVGRF